MTEKLDLEVRPSRPSFPLSVFWCRRPWPLAFVPFVCVCVRRRCVHTSCGCVGKRGGYGRLMAPPRRGGLLLAGPSYQSSVRPSLHSNPPTLNPHYSPFFTPPTRPSRRPSPWAGLARPRRSPAWSASSPSTPPPPTSPGTIGMGTMVCGFDGGRPVLRTVCIAPESLNSPHQISQTNPPQPLLQRGRRHCHRQHIKRWHCPSCFYRATRERGKEAHGSYYTCACFVLVFLSGVRVYPSPGRPCPRLSFIGLPHCCVTSLVQLLYMCVCLCE